MNKLPYKAIKTEYGVPFYRKSDMEKWGIPENWHVFDYQIDEVIVGPVQPVFVKDGVPSYDYDDVVKYGKPCEWVRSVCA